MKRTISPRIGIIRGLMPRLTQAEFAASFTTYEPVFITGESSNEITSYCKEKGLLHRDLPVQPIWYSDPLEMLFKRRVHQSWVNLSHLEEACHDLTLLQTYELYHFFSGQAASLSKRMHIPLVCEVWTSFAEHPAYLLPPYSLTVKKVIKQASLFIARSHKVHVALRKLGIPDEKIIVLYQGINVQRFVPRKQKKNKQQVVLFVGELEAYKGVAQLLAIWPSVQQKYPNAKLVLIGKGSLEEIAKKVSGVQVLGYVPHAELPFYYQRADLFVSLSQDRYIGPFLWWEEFFSYTLMEAMASGLPIIATNSGGISEEIGKENWLLDQGQPQAACRALCEALSDGKRLQQVGIMNRKRAEKCFDLFRNTQVLEKRLQSLL